MTKPTAAIKRPLVLNIDDLLEELVTKIDRTFFDANPKRTHHLRATASEEAVYVIDNSGGPWPQFVIVRQIEPGVYRRWYIVSSANMTPEERHAFVESLDKDDDLREITAQLTAAEGVNATLQSANRE